MIRLLCKILRITAWLLVIATILALFSGYLTVKYFLLTGIDYRSIHINILPWIFIPLFYIHSAIGLINLLTRHKITNRKSVKIIAQILWLAIFVPLVLIILAKAPVIAPTNSNNNNGNNNNSNNSQTSQGTKLTLAEIAKHNSSSDCWLIVSNKIYNVTTYLRAHPSGSSTILPYCGKDGTQAFVNQGHSSNANSILADFYIGDVGATITPLTTPTTPPVTTPPSTNNGDDDDDD